MYGLSERTWFALAIGCYTLAAGYGVLMWRRGFARDDWWCYGLLVLGWLPHTAALMGRGISLQRCPVTNLFEVVMFLSWMAVAATAVLGLWRRLRLLGAFVAPWLVAVGVFGLQPRLDVPGPQMELAHGVVSLHVALILLAYGLFGLSAAAGVMYLVQENDLKFHKVRAVLSRLPAIERLEKVVTYSLVAGLILLTSGLALSPFLKRGGANFGADPKLLWSLVVWGAYAALVAVRCRVGRGNRWMAWGAVASFAFILLTFWGTNLMSPLHN